MEPLIVLVAIMVLLLLLDVAALTVGVDSRNFGPPGLE